MVYYLQNMVVSIWTSRAKKVVEGAIRDRGVMMGGVSTRCGPGRSDDSPFSGHKTIIMPKDHTLIFIAEANYS